MLRDELMDGGFIQLIHNGYGPFFFRNPFDKAVRQWGEKVQELTGVKGNEDTNLIGLCRLLRRVRKCYDKYHNQIEKEMSDDDKLSAPSFENLPGGFAMKAGQGLYPGPEKEMDITKEEVEIQDVPNDFWSAWQKEATRLEKLTVSKAADVAPSTPAAGPVTKAKKVLRSGLPKKAVPASGRMYRVGWGTDSSLHPGLKKDVVSRPWTRRDSAGFERYVAGLDRMMSGNVRSFIDNKRKENESEK